MDPRHTRATPFEDFLTAVRSKLTTEDFDDAFLTRLYEEAFRVGPIPANRNHFAMSCEDQVESGPRLLTIKYWLDLDRLARQVNTHFQINPPYRFKVEFTTSVVYTSGAIDDRNYSYTTRSMINSVESPYARGNMWLMRSILFRYLSGVALLMATLPIEPNPERIGVLFQRQMIACPLRKNRDDVPSANADQRESAPALPA